MTESATDSRVRDTARRYIEAVLTGEIGADDVVGSEAADFDQRDRALFQELTHGTIREWLFLDWVVAKYAPKPSRASVRTILNLSAYQLLFLTRVPDYAVFSQAAAISSSLGLTEPELKFVHGVLKTIQRNKDKLLEIREASLARLRRGCAPEGTLEWAILNATPALIDALTVVEEKGQKKVARERAVRAVAAMKDKAGLVGYVLPGQLATCELMPLQSEVAPLAMVFTASPELGKDLKDGNVRIQGEASQWSCGLAAQWIDRHRGDKPLRILEMAVGKGGKLLGTLAALTSTWGGNPKSVPPIEWWATDISTVQLRYFERDVTAIAQKIWPQVRIEVRCVDWRKPEASGALPGDFDIVWLDAPCSGFGTIEKLPQISLTRGMTAYDEALRMAELQKTLCVSGVKRLGPKGAFFYTVCTMTRPETLDIVEFFSKQLGRSAAHVQALWPGSPPAPEAEGFFAAIL